MARRTPVAKKSLPLSWHTMRELESPLGGTTSGCLPSEAK
jgi:hypothetical protein